MNEQYPFEGYTLDIGAGAHSKADVQMDIYKFNKETILHDVLDFPYPFKDEEFDEVRAEQILEHIPPVIAYPIPMKAAVGELQITHMNPRVRVMKEIYRVLKPRGVLHASVPANENAQAQDPTHVSPRWTVAMFSYFCGQWGGGQEGTHAYHGYGINFQFDLETHFETGDILTVRLRKR